MKKFIFGLCLVASFQAMAETPIFHMFYKTGFIAEEFAYTKICDVYTDRVEIMFENIEGTHQSTTSIEVDHSWKALIERASLGALLPNPFSSSFYVSEFHAYKDSQKIILKGFDENNEAVLNESPEAAQLIVDIETICH